MNVTSVSRVLAIVGDPIEHSLSPAMYNAAIEALGLDAVYVGFRVDGVSVPHVMRAFEALGIAGNVTVPHKVAVASLLIRVTGIAKDVGAVNTFWPENGRLIGDNTDVQGVIEAVEELDRDGPWLIIGTGGAARAAVIAAREHDTPVRIKSRQPSRAQEVVEWAQARGVKDARTDDEMEEIGVVINATPVGLNNKRELPLPANRLDRCSAGLDMVYRREPTAFVSFFRTENKPAIDGRPMLIAQGAAAFERFFPGVRAPREIMRAAVNRWIAPPS